MTQGPAMNADRTTDRSADRSGDRAGNRTGAHRAFTLLEMLLVLGIVATVSAIAIPRYLNSLDRYRADAAARRVVADLAYARSEARAHSAVRTVRFDKGTETYTLLGVADPDHRTVPYVVRLLDAPYGAGIVMAEFDDPRSVLDPLDEIQFDGYGVPDSDGTVVIAVGTSTRTIGVDGDTGEATVQ